MKRLLFGVAILGLMSSASIMAAGSGELWEVTSKMEIPDMPFAMPGQTSKLCMKMGNEKNPINAIPKNNDQDCKMTDIKIFGSKSSWYMKCDGKNPMTGIGEMNYGDGSYSGKMKMNSMDGDMMVAYEGRRVGTCRTK